MSIKHLCATALSAIILNTAIGQNVVNAFATDPLTSDMALIYIGNETRPTWNKTAFKPHVVHSYADGRPRTWMFDSFLFIESQVAGKKLTNVVGGASGAATKTQWEDLFKFQMGITNSGEGMGVLDDLIESLKPTLGAPSFGKHKIVMQLPTPQDGQTNWGSVNGKSLNFNNADDQQTAFKWAIDRILELWNQCNFQNLELVGLYCIDENMKDVATRFRTISPYIHDKGLKLYWIPYFTENTSKTAWAANGVDVAYQQPNYYFDKNIYKAQLRSAIEDAKKYGMGLELEFHPDALWDYNRKSTETDDTQPSSASFYNRLKAYIDEFESYGVFDSSAIAYYSGNNGFNAFFYSQSAKDAELMDRLAAFIDTRHQKRAGVKPVAAESHVFAIAGCGCIEILDTAPDTCIYTVGGTLIHKGSGKVYCPAGIYVATDGAGSTQKLAVH